MGVMKLAEAAMATAIIRAWGESPIPAEVLSTIGAISTTRAAVGTKQVARKVNATIPNITPPGPKGPTRVTTHSAISFAAPV